MNAIEKLNTLTMSRAEAQDFTNAIRDAILSGDVDPLRLEVGLKSLENAISGIRKDEEIRAAVLSQAAKHGKTFTAHGAEISVTERRTFDFTFCNDAEWDLLNEEEARVKEEKKRREAFLRTIPEAGVVDPETGALIYAPTFTTTEVLTIKIR